ncbi:MAG: AMP-binding protein [Clostridiales bacterium]|jgi:fatty-acyl-CoA synthase|nr:AMP-binding protein [Clostridiales bacterium]
MKISFSTLACPDFSWRDIYSLAKDLGFNGVEIRGLGDEICAVRARPFSGGETEKTRELLSRLGLEISCFSSGCCLKFKDKKDENFKEISEYIKTANRAGSPYVRVLADLSPKEDGEADDAFIAGQLKELAPIARAADVTLLIETNGVFADTKRLRALLDSVGESSVAALWDVHHPLRFKGETPAQTVANLGGYIKYTHVKDSVIDASGDISYRRMGEGSLPLPEIFAELQKAGFSGWVSLEWVKRWSAELESAGLALPHFAQYMERYAGGRAPLFTDERGGGRYIWPKETLINETFPDVLDRVCEEFPNQYAFRYTELDYARTYPEFRDDVDAFAAALINMGVGKGAHVAVWATNTPEWFITFWAAVKIGAVLVTVNTAYKIHEAEYLLRQSDTHTLVTLDGHKDSNYMEILREICPELETSEPGRLHSKRLPRLRNVVSAESRQKGCFFFRDVFEAGKKADKAELARRRAEISTRDVCNMQYTSGTTGFPKGVMLTHYNVVNNGKAIGDCLDLSSGDHMMIQVPMFHCFGMVLAMTASMTHAAAMSPITAFSPRKGLECIRRERVTAFHGVPTMFIAMLEHPDFAATDFSNIRTGIMAGSPCPVKVMEDVLSKMNMRDVCITYGQTESSPAITMSRASDPSAVRVSTVGSPVFAVEVKIVNPETGETLPGDADGELCARGYNIMKGYYKMPEATKAVIDPDGWLHTGDLARRGADGNYKITGRIKDMIIRGGENIYPKEIEEFLYTHPKIRDVQVIGAPDEQYGEEICACVILKTGESLTEDEVKEFVRSHMAKHKVPKYVQFLDEFPMNAAGKILKYKMRENAAESLGLKGKVFEG